LRNGLVAAASSRSAAAGASDLERRPETAAKRAEAAMIVVKVCILMDN